MVRIIAEGLLSDNPQELGLYLSKIAIKSHDYYLIFQKTLTLFFVFYFDTCGQQQVFKPFFSNNRGTGHGLGLAFCERVVHSASGTISVKSDYAVGATFTIELPLKA